MKLKYQRFLYISFFLAFFVIGPLLVTYATGYRYNFKKNSFEKTGVLVASSLPRDAQFMLDEKALDTTPVELRYLLPQQYTVTMSKDGYHPWKRTVEVRSNETTYITDAVLFRDTLPTLVDQGDVRFVSVSPNERHLLYSVIVDEQEQLMLKTLPNTETQVVQSLNTKQYDSLEFVDWSAQSQKALLRQTTKNFSEYLVLDLQTRALTNIFDANRIQFERVLWSTDNDFLLYGTRNNQLYEINLVSLTTTKLLDDVFNAYQASQDAITYISQVQNDVLLTRQSRVTQENKYIKLPSTDGDEYQLLRSAPGTISLHDTLRNQLYVIDERAFETETSTIDSYIILQTDAVDAVWNSTLATLLIASEFEISRFDLPSKTLSLITRQSTPLSHAQWHLDGQYIFYIKNNTLQVIEATHVPGKSELTLASARLLSQLVNSSFARRAYFVAEIGSQKGLYELILR